MVGLGTGIGRRWAASFSGLPQEMVHMKNRTENKVLVRSRNGRVLGGVCAGVASYLGLDVTLVRVIWAAAAVFTGGTGFLAYLAAWALIPEEGQKSSIVQNGVSKKKPDVFSG
jgi:phage shock protein PspC (stress-responsive transcriptional regulator)